MLNIKILHLHSNNITFPLLRDIFKGKIIHTVHADVESRLGKKADLIICIHKDAYDKNKKFGNAKIIENTVDFPIRKEDYCEIPGGVHKNKVLELNKGDI